MSYGTVLGVTESYLAERVIQRAETEVTCPHVIGDLNLDNRKGKPDADLVEVHVMFGGGLEEIFLMCRLYAELVGQWLAEQCEAESIKQDKEEWRIEIYRAVTFEGEGPEYVWDSQTHSA